VQVTEIAVNASKIARFQKTIRLQMDRMFLAQQQAVLAERMSLNM